MDAAAAGPRDDETQAGPAASGETDRWPHSDDTSAAALAYSASADTIDDDSDDAGQARSGLGRYALGALLVLITAGAVAVTAVLLVDRLKRRDTPAVVTATITAAPTPPTAPAPAPAATPPPPVFTTPPTLKPDADTVYLQLMARAGVTAGTKDAAIYMGHQICQRLDQGESAKDIMWSIMNPAQGISHAAASGVVGAAVTAYCPKYENEPRF